KGFSEALGHAFVADECTPGGGECLALGCGPDRHRAPDASCAVVEGPLTVCCLPGASPSSSSSGSASSSGSLAPGNGTCNRSPRRAGCTCTPTHVTARGTCDAVCICGAADDGGETDAAADAADDAADDTSGAPSHTVACGSFACPTTCNCTDLRAC